jgi:hypothetical protein
MLPDFPKLKEELRKVLDRRMRSERARSAGPLGAASPTIVYEGFNTEIIRNDGSREKMAMHHHKVAVSFTNEELESLSLEEIYRRFDDAAQDMALQMGKTFFQVVDKTLEDVGNVMKYEGEFSVDDLLAMWAKIEIDFDDDGQPQMPTLVCPAGQEARAEAVTQELQTEENQRRVAALMEKKKEEWRDREASRKLVD